MYIGIDIGGTKTLATTLDENGVITAEQRFPTNKDYNQFLVDLTAAFATIGLDDSIDYRCCVGIPGQLDREAGTVLRLGNLPWENKPIRDDISRVLNGRHVLIENDARLAGLSEAQLIKQYRRVFFITVSTGIGVAMIQDGKIVTFLQDVEMGKMPLWHNDKYVNWEDFASGRAIVEQFNQMAYQITDPAIWHQIGLNVAQGLAVACATFEPEVIVLGGSVGVQADKFIDTLSAFLKDNLHPVIKQPSAILAAQRPDNAVIYGCFDQAKQHANQ